MQSLFVCNNIDQEMAVKSEERRLIPEISVDMPDIEITDVDKDIVQIYRDKGTISAFVNIIIIYS